MSTIFEGIRVLDLSEGMAGSLATMIMADNGAEVIKAARPGGDPFRSMPAWIMWNRGKRGIVLDLDSEAGRARLDDLARRVDVLVESARSADAARLGLDPARLAEINPRLIHASIVAFAAVGDYADLPPYGPIVEAKGGVPLKFQVEVGRDEPSLRVRPNASWATVNTLLQAVSAALISRERTGARTAPRSEHVRVGHGLRHVQLGAAPGRQRDARAGDGAAGPGARRRFRQLSLHGRPLQGRAVAPDGEHGRPPLSALDRRHGP